MLPPALQRLCQGLTLPVIGAPMFIVSGLELVRAQCRAGIIGSFPALNARGGGALDDWLAELGAITTAPGAAPFAVNLIVHRTNTRLEADLAVLEKHRVPLVITSLGAREDINAAVHGWGGVVLHDVISDAFARKAIAKGADGLIAVAAGAGGHAGAQSPFALMQEIRAWFSGPLALSGAIANGAAILAAQALGADFAYIGSAWIACEEANATEAYAQAIVAGSAADIVTSKYFTGVSGNYLKASVIAAGLDPENLPAHGQATDFAALGADAPKAWRDIWGAGQGIGAVHAVVPVAARVAQLSAEYRAAITALAERTTGARKGGGCAS